MAECGSPAQETGVCRHGCCRGGNVDGSGRGEAQKKLQLLQLLGHVWWYAHLMFEATVVLGQAVVHVVLGRPVIQWNIREA